MAVGGRASGRAWAVAVAAGVVACGAVAAVVTSVGGAARPPDLALIVLDTVRAASTSLCGYGRPTTPVMLALKASGWATTCGAVSPGTWTVPSHASMFTGWSVTAFDGGRVEPPPDATLAGRLGARGYQTVLVSANMVLRKPDWLSSGFDRRIIARDYSELAGDALGDAVRAELDRADPDRPLFLFVNVADAHAPYPEIPPDVGWVPPQRAVQHRMWSADPTTPFRRYVTGGMDAPEAARYREHLRNGYDYGVHEADRSLGRVLDALRDHGRLSRARVVVTSDHGEFVGEHGQVGHGDTLYEPGVRVPLLMLDAPASAPRPLPEPMSARQAFSLLMDGELAEQPAPASVVIRQPSDRPGYDGVAVWGIDGEKLLWRDGTFERYDLGQDPEETSAAPIGPQTADPLMAELETMVEAQQATLAANRAANQSPDADTVELLRAAGYVE